MEPMARLSIALLGPMQVTLNGQAITAFRSSKNQVLLAYLAVEAHRGHDRATLAGLLWPEHPEPKALRNLRQSLFRLRGLLNQSGTDYIQVDRRGVRFAQDEEHWLDVAFFAQLLERCQEHAHRARAECRPCIARLAEAVALYRGDFLEGIFLGDSPGTEEWLLLKREWLRLQVLEALADLAHFHQQRGEYEQAVRYAWRQVELDPLREEAHQQIMRALARAGRRDQALAQYERCRQVLAEELGVEPSSETTLLAQAIRAQELETMHFPTGISTGPPPVTEPHRPSLDRPAHNLPAQSTRLIGREEELAHLRAWLLDPEERLVTLVGEGGVGKTRLAQAAARAVLPHFGHGAWFVPLAGVGSKERTAPTRVLVESLAMAVAGALGFAFRGAAPPATQLLDYLSTKEMLLVLDNFEHLLPAGELLPQILQAAPQVTLLVTSRERLQLQAERVVRVTGLPVPAPEDPGGQTYASVRLFVERASRTAAGITLAPEELPAVAEICRLLQGLPLGIELAVSWVEQFSPTEIAQAIQENLDFLISTMQDLPERHRSLRATFDHSWRLLSPQEQRLLAQLSVFQGSWSREATQAVTGAGLSHLVALVNKSLVQVVAPGRYTLHPLVRQLAGEQLAADGQAQQATLARHCQYYTQLLARHEAQLMGERQGPVRALLEAERTNLHAAWSWAVQQRAVTALSQAADGLHRLYKQSNYFQEGAELFEQAAQAVGSLPPSLARDRLWGRLLARQGDFVSRLGRYQAAVDRLEQSLALLGRTGDELEIAYALGYLGLARERQGRYQEAKALQQESLVRYTALDNRHGMARALRMMASAAEGLQEYAEASSLLRRSLLLCQELGDRRGAALALNLLGIVTEMQGSLAQARGYYQESLALFTEINDKWGMQLPLGNLGDVAFTQGDYQEAKARYRAALAALQESWTVPYMLIQLYRIAAVLAREGRFLDAATLLQLPLHHPGLDQAFRRRAQALHAELTAALPPDELLLAQARGRQQSLAQAVAAAMGSG